MKRKILTSIFIVILLAIAVIGFNFMKMVKEIESFDKSPIDISLIADGVYHGQTETMLIKVEVKVVVAIGKIDDIFIVRHDSGKGLPANAIVEEIISKNSPEVDAVAGVTASSEVIKEAVRRALRSGITKSR